MSNKRFSNTGTLSNISLLSTWGLHQPQDELQVAKQKLEQISDHVRRLEKSPAQLGVVQRITDDRIILIGAGNRVEVERPMGPLGQAIRIGCTVKINEKLQIVGVLDYDFCTGETFKVRAVFDQNRRVEIETPTGVRVVMLGDVIPQPGDRVIVDMTGSVVVDVLPQRADEKFALLTESGVTWDDIGGLEDAKREMREAIENPHKFREHYARYGKKTLKGILLHGAPGCGKSMLCKAAATTIAQVHGAKHPGAFLYVKGPELLDKFVGATEAAIRQLFDSARAHKKQHGYPAIIFIDEADSLLARRRSGGQIHSSVDMTIVPQFLSEMDGLDESGAMVILATNRADVLDPAVVRDGRIDRKIHVPRPDRLATAQIFEKVLRNKPTHDCLPVLVEFATDRLFSNSHALMEVTTTSEKIEAKHNFTLEHIVSGAMVASIVDRATSKAIARESKTQELLGITRDDVSESIRNTLEENRALDHSDDFARFMEPLQKKVTGVRKIETTA